MKGRRLLKSALAERSYRNQSRFALGSSFCDQTSCVPQDSIAVFHSRWRWFPSRLQPRLEKFICARLVFPHGNCRNPAQSSCPVDKYKSISPRHDYIVTVLILDHDVCDHLRKNLSDRLSKAPVQNLLKRAMPSNFVFDRGEFIRRQSGMIHSIHRSFRL
jgi:hypothetical protein